MLIERRLKLRTHVQYTHTHTHNRHKMYWRKTKTKKSYDWSLVVRVFSFVHCSFAFISLRSHFFSAPQMDSGVSMSFIYIYMYLYAVVCCCSLLFSQKAIIIHYVFTLSVYLCYRFWPTAAKDSTLNKKRANLCFLTVWELLQKLNGVAFTMPT